MLLSFAIALLFLLLELEVANLRFYLGKVAVHGQVKAAVLVDSAVVRDDVTKVVFTLC